MPNNSYKGGKQWNELQKEVPLFFSTAYPGTFEIVPKDRNV